jgi:hypothetical protein
MDEDVKAHLRGMEERTAALIAGEVGALRTQLQQSEGRLGARLDSIDSRLKLQAGLIQSGARVMALVSRSNNGQALSGDKVIRAASPVVGEFAENSEERWVALVGRVEALERKIEGGAGKG